MTLSLKASLHAELLSHEARVPFALTLDLPSVGAEVLECIVPDGAVSQVVLPARMGNVTTLLVTSDKAVLVCLGPALSNTPIALQPCGILGFGGGEVPSGEACGITYTPGDGSVATCLVYASFVYGVLPPIEADGWRAEFEYPALGVGSGWLAEYEYAEPAVGSGWLDEFENDGWRAEFEYDLIVVVGSGWLAELDYTAPLPDVGNGWATEFDNIV